MPHVGRCADVKKGLWSSGEILQRYVVKSIETFGFKKSDLGEGSLKTQKEEANSIRMLGLSYSN
jgi:hypothetical protein